MQTVILEQPGRFTLADTPPPGDPGPGEAIVRVRQVGICGTDLHAYRGRQPFFTYPRILGHELGVEVVAVGQGVTQVGCGDRCAVEPYLTCGRCIACRRGRSNCCESLQCLGVHTDGGMRSLLRLPAAKLHPSNQLSLDQLALVETLGIGCHAVDRAQLEAGEGVLVIGAGPIGLGVTLFACAAGARVVVMDINADRLNFCRRSFEVAATVAADDDAPQRVRDALGGDLPAAVFDATGHSGSMHRAFDLVAHGGRLVLVGLFVGDVTFHDPEFHRREMTLLATRNSTAADFARIIAMMEQGRIDTQPWITHRTDAAGMLEQFEGWLDQTCGVIKAMVVF
jgi:2-desacetyl-2-hydroxyethyl bacteriochlorophyllide A dehydrogenase